jgi:peroxiredoxin
MPQLDRLYRELSSEGLMVFGFSVEDVALQLEFVKRDVPVTYPLLTTNGNVPDMYRSIQQYPATFLIDRQGQLRPAPGPGEPFEKLETAVRSLLTSKGD